MCVCKMTWGRTEREHTAGRGGDSARKGGVCLCTHEHVVLTLLMRGERVDKEGWRESGRCLECEA